MKICVLVILLTKIFFLDSLFMSLNVHAYYLITRYLLANFMLYCIVNSFHPLHVSWFVRFSLRQALWEIHTSFLCTFHRVCTDRNQKDNTTCNNILPRNICSTWKCNSWKLTTIYNDATVIIVANARPHIKYCTV